MSKLSRRQVLSALGAGAAAAAATTAGCRVAARNPGAGVGRGIAPVFAERSSVRFLLPADHVFLNTGSLGACPEAVLDATMAAWRCLELAPVHEEFGPLRVAADRVRQRAAAFLGAEPDEVCVTRNTTDGMNLVAEGLALQAGDRVLTTDHEHPGGERCWQHAERHRGIAIDRVRLPLPAVDPDRIVQLVRAALTPKTRVVSVSHVTSTTGTRLPVRQLAEVAHAGGALLVVDGAQAAGAAPVDVHELGCDAYACSAHKWMLAPKGTGLLYLAKSARERITPSRLFDGPGVYTAATGTGDLPAVIGLGAAIEFLERLDVTAIAAHDLAVRDRLYEALTAFDRVRIVSPPPGDLAAPMVAIELHEDVDCGAVRDALRERDRIAVKQLPANKVHGLRFSTHLYNTMSDVDALMAALERELGDR
ncbi:MAG: aminotransferase class V-fold PLP-dependent enzyme [bacterium]|nr:aminotransferase class V-fold PLP-dependent enzyme [bacterium]